MEDYAIHLKAKALSVLAYVFMKFYKQTTKKDCIEKGYFKPNTNNRNDIPLSKRSSKNICKIIRKKSERKEKLFQIGWSLMFQYIDDDNYLPMYEIDSRKVAEDINSIENWFLTEGYKKYFSDIRAEGHDDYGIGGSAWVNENQLEDCNIEGWSMGMGNFHLPLALEESIDPNLECSLIPYDFEEKISIEEY